MGETLDVAIIGAGFAGIGAAIALRQRGVENLRVFEKASGVGGTWWVNRYPGCACDVQSHLYSFSFAPNPRWSRSFPTQPEIAEYLQRVCEDYSLASCLRLGRDVQRLVFDESRQCWRLEFADGKTVHARTVVGAFGALSKPASPDIPGLATFAGRLFHSQQWDHDFDMRGKRIAVIGTGASAIQFVPQIAPLAEHIAVFQRTPPWILPKPDRAIGNWKQQLYQRLPLTQKLARGIVYAHLESRAVAFIYFPSLLRMFQRLARRHMHKAIAEPQLRKKLTPDYLIGCKRVLISNDYYPALARPNVDVVTEPIQAIESAGVRTTDGALQRVDALILGTGFAAANPFARGFITGPAGRDLAEAWRDGPSAYLGTAVAGFPNLFLLGGPNTGLGHNSMVYMLESQIHYLCQALPAVLREDQALQVRDEVQQSYNEALQSKLAGTVWQTGGCHSWYQNETGKNVALWPGFTFSFRRRLKNFNRADYCQA